MSITKPNIIQKRSYYQINLYISLNWLLGDTFSQPVSLELCIGSSFRGHVQIIWATYNRKKNNQQTSGPINKIVSCSFFHSSFAKLISTGWFGFGRSFTATLCCALQWPNLIPMNIWKFSCVRLSVRLNFICRKIQIYLCIYL